MLLNLRNNLHWISLIIGLFVYPYIVGTSLSLGIVWLIFILYLWLTLSILFDSYQLNNFLFSVCIIGILIAVSIFFIHGIEEVPFPEGAIIFKTEGIAQALMVFFIFSVPLIIYKHQPAISEQTSFLTKKDRTRNNPSQPIPTNETDENWEEATIEDLESGDFEVSE